MVLGEGGADIEAGEGTVFGECSDVEAIGADEAAAAAVAAARVDLDDGPLGVLADGGADFALGGYAIVS